MYSYGFLRFKDVACIYIYIIVYMYICIYICICIFIMLNKNTPGVKKSEAKSEAPVSIHACD